MMNKELIEQYNNPIERLITYHTFLSGKDSDSFEDQVSYSLKELSELTGIPLPVIRKDFMMIFEYSESVNQW